MPLKIPPAIATPLIKGGRGDLNTIYSIQEVFCVSPEILMEGWVGASILFGFIPKFLGCKLSGRDARRRDRTLSL